MRSAAAIRTRWGYCTCCVSTWFRHASHSATPASDECRHRLSRRSISPGGNPRRDATDGTRMAWLSVPGVRSASIIRRFVHEVAWFILAFIPQSPPHDSRAGFPPAIGRWRGSIHTASASAVTPMIQVGIHRSSLPGWQSSGCTGGPEPAWVTFVRNRALL